MTAVEVNGPREEAERELDAARRRLAEARRLTTHAQSDYFRGLARDQQQARQAYFAAYRAELDAEERVKRAERRLAELDALQARKRVA